MTEFTGFCDFVEQLIPAELELLIGTEFGYKVVVVGVEPLGHFLGVCPAAATVTDTTRHAEQGLQSRLAIVWTKALRDHTEHQRMGQNLVVPSEVAHRQQLNPGLLLQVPMGFAQVTADGTQAGFIQFAFPERLLCFFSSRSRPMRGNPREWATAMSRNSNVFDGRYCR